MAQPKLTPPVRWRFLASLIVLCLSALGMDAAQRVVIRNRLDPDNVATAAVNPIADSRKIDWAGTAGVSGGIRSRSTICVTSECNTMTAAGTGVSIAQINAAIVSAPADSVIKLGSGTFTMSGGILITRSDVTFRGNGPDATFLRVSGLDSCTNDTVICVGSRNVNPESPSVVASWSAGFAKGDTTITLSTKSGLSVGKLIYLDRLIDSSTDNGGLWLCAREGICSSEADSHINRNSGPPIAESSNRSQSQVVVVTSIEGGSCAPNCDIGISPGLLMPNWNAGTPEAWWSSAGATPSFVGIEDMSVENTTTNGFSSNIAFAEARDSWVKNVRTVHGNRAHFSLYGTLRITVRDSYLFGNETGAATAYGFETNISSSYVLENNICQHLQSCFTMGQNVEGSVIAYNFAIDSYYCGTPGPTTGWMQAGLYHHTAGIAMTLFEGNDTTGFTADNIHGTSHFATLFRNRLQGYDPEGCSSSGKTSQTVPVHVYAFNRYFNVIGNVLGDNRRAHTTYQGNPASSSTAGPHADANQIIYALGWSGDMKKDTDTGTIPNDLKVFQTMFRWGNWDTVSSTSDTSSNDTSGIKWDSSEVPTGDSFFPQTVPSTQALPASLYLPAKPSWWPSSIPWPAIGPDVTGGNVSEVGGHAYRIPAARCFYTIMGGVGNETSPLSFNANNCY